MNNWPDSTSAMEEFKALRAEIAGRSQAQLTLLSINFATLGILSGFVLKEKQSEVLLLIPILSSSLGLLYMDHASNINNIGFYIGQFLGRVLAKADNPDATAFQYELWIRQGEKSRGQLRLMMWGVPILVGFGGAPIAALVLSFNILDDQMAYWGLWVAGLVLTVFFVVFAALFIRRPQLLTLKPKAFPIE